MRLRPFENVASFAVVLAFAASVGCSGPHDCGELVDWGTDETLGDAGEDAPDDLEASVEAGGTLDATDERDAALTSPDADAALASGENADATDSSAPGDAGPPDSGRRTGP